MIKSKNRSHAEDDLPAQDYDLAEINRKMPQQYADALDEFTATSDGKKALKKFKQFWGVPLPVEIKKLEIPGPQKKTLRLTGLGRAPKAFIADEPGGKTRSISGPFTVVCDPDGKKVMLLSGKSCNANKAKLTFLGYVPKTEYIPSRALESAGTFKKGKHWVHLHNDEGGEWPKAWVDQAGNIRYGVSTLRIGKWMRR